VIVEYDEHIATLQPTLDAITGMLERGNGQEEDRA
jgi:hypothetical protein